MVEIFITLTSLLNKYKELLKEASSSDLSFNESLVLQVVAKKDMRKCEIREYLYKDKSQIHRVIEGMVRKRLLKKLGNSYILTQNGLEEYEKISAINTSIMKSLNSGTGPSNSSMLEQLIPVERSISDLIK